jgi:hypothetical protein
MCRSTASRSLRLQTTAAVVQAATQRRRHGRCPLGPAPSTLLRVHYFTVASMARGARRVELWANGAVGRTSARARPCASSPRPLPTPARPRRAAAAVQAAQPRTLTVRFGRRHKPTHSKRVHARARTRAAARSDQCIAQPTSGGIGGGARACSASAGFNLCLCLRWECACWRWCGWAASSW